MYWYNPKSHTSERVEAPPTTSRPYACLRDTRTPQRS